MSALSLARTLDPGRFEPVVSQHVDGLLSDYLDLLGLPAMPAPDVALPRLRPVWRQPFTVLRLLNGLSAFLRKHRIDIVHSHDLRMHVAWGLAARGAGIPHVWHQRTPSPSPVTHRFSRHSAVVLTVSEYCRSKLPGAMARRAEIVPNPVELDGAIGRDRARATLSARLGQRGEDGIVGFVSNLADRKRPELFVEVAARLVEAMPGADLAFPMIGAGDTEVRRRVEARIRDLGLGDRVQLLGPCFPVAPLIEGMDLLIAPARHEAFGRTLVEAMLAGTPVVASDDGGHSDIVDEGRTGRLVPPDDGAAMAHAAGALLSDAAMRSGIRARAREEAERRFSPQAHTARVSEIYDRVTAGASGGV
ncbi:hypothetical protein OCH239_01025 [Roseivivax halodurans JCM 10272]|uniref:Glycosyltransferase subfamily 4-like N-terminal domain-containing protein n=1 Tax=Roseivivax halodurans JCM 10272 TaxID=1449350 RepID=X7ENG5_9RHOB|nr:hypothetical protein OCH239_01025 [Roseivivax halodurans JCM 10272]